MKTILLVKELAERWGIGINSTYEGIRTGEIPHIKIGGRIIIPLRAIENLEENGSKQGVINE